MNDILTIFSHVIILLSSSIIQSIFILNQSAKYCSFKKALPSMIAGCISYSIIIYIIIFNTEFLFIYMLWFIAIPIFVIGFIFFMYMGYNTWHQSYFNSTNIPKSVSIQKLFLEPVYILVLSIFNPFILDMLNTVLYKYRDYNTKVIYILIPIYIWFLLLSIIGYNIRKLSKGAIILKILNKVGAITIWGIALLYLPQTIITIKSWINWLS
ncbi:MAG: hypothetical protein LN566_03345 [Rickettsia endosymbiont of Stiretrus anchorago]|nr:hypothetical protein [Rickettsia endosymbiont of Stiretrus anchorago]